MKKQSSYEESYRELTQIISELEDETISVDKLTVKVKRAMELIGICREKLLMTEKEIHELVKE